MVRAVLEHGSKRSQKERKAKRHAQRNKEIQTVEIQCKDVKMYVTGKGVEDWLRTYLPREAILLIPSVTIRFLIERKFRVETQNEADFKRNEHNDEDDVPLPPQRKLPSSPCYRRTSDERIETEMSPLPKTLSHVERYVGFCFSGVFSVYIIT